MKARMSRPLGRSQGSFHGLHSYTTSLPVPPTKTSQYNSSMYGAAFLTIPQCPYLRNGKKTGPTYCVDIQLHADSATLDTALPPRRDTQRAAMEVCIGCTAYPWNTVAQKAACTGRRRFCGVRSICDAAGASECPSASKQESTHLNLLLSFYSPSHANK